MAAKVKQLEWNRITPFRWDAETPLIDYTIRLRAYDDFEKKFVEPRYVVWDQCGENFATLEEAMQWFQDVFDEAVLECLE